MPAQSLVVGTRGSRLALRQTEEVAAALRQAHPRLAIEVKIVKTAGDRDVTSPLSRVGGQGLFVKGLESALLAGEIDMAVHSLKDIPTEPTPGLALAAVTARADVRDAFLSRDGRTFREMPAGARIGSGSQRRAVQLRALRPDVQVVDIRGNVDTRIRKMDQGQVDGLVLAMAGLARLGLEERAVEVFPAETVLPAVGQGALAVQTREEHAVRELLAVLDHHDTRQATAAERAFLRRLGSGCRLPVTALGTVDGPRLTLRGMVADVAGGHLLRAQVEGPTAEAEALGVRLAEELLAMGARELWEEEARGRG